MKYDEKNSQIWGIDANFKQIDWNSYVFYFLKKSDLIHLPPTYPPTNLPTNQRINHSLLFLFFFWEFVYKEK